MTTPSPSLRSLLGGTAAVFLLHAAAAANELQAPQGEVPRLQVLEFVPNASAPAEQAAEAPAAEQASLFVDAGGPTEAARAVLDALADAPSHALPAGRYRAQELRGQADALASGGSPADRRAFEKAMKNAFLAYARDITSGVTTPSEIDRELKIKVERPEAEALLKDLARATDPAAYLASLAPADPEYARLREHLSRMTNLARAGGWGETVPAGATLRAGDSGKRVELIRARLIATGDLGPQERHGEGAVMAINDVVNDAAQPVTLSDPWVYDDTLVAAVKRFQARHGLNTDGVVGPATLAALNTSAADRARAIAVNMERLRWLNRDLGDKRVMVNLAGFTMKLIDNGRVTFSSRVVVGDPDHHTPEFSDEIEHMVVNPSWNVPSSIAVNEILPKLRRDPAYLARNNMTLVGADPWYIDWWNVSASNFPGRIKQLPGPGNALGSVKFMFPNDNAIYLHDTPSKSLFAKDSRAFSHGCVRVEKPHEFARILLAAQESDPARAFDRMLHAGKERWVPLTEHIPVHLTYRTAWLDDDGIEHYRTDIYGRDRQVMAALEKAGVSLGL